MHKIKPYTVKDIESEHDIPLSFHKGYSIKGNRGLRNKSVIALHLETDKIHHYIFGETTIEELEQTVKSKIDQEEMEAR